MAINWGGVGGIIFFYLIIVVIGLWASRKTKGANKTEQVMVANRQFGPIFTILTLTASWVGGGYINGTAEIVFTPGFGLIWAQFPWVVAISFNINALFFAEKMRAANYITMLDPFSEKYGARVGGIIAITSMLAEVLYTAAILTALGSTMNVVLGLDQSLSVIVSACIAALYTLLGGLYSVSYTDMAQLALMLFGLWLSIPFVFTNPAVASPSVTTDAWVGSIDSKYMWLWIDSFLLLAMGGVPWQIYYQRVLACKTPRQARYTTFVASFTTLIASIPAYLIGIAAASTDWNMTAIDLNTTDIYTNPSVILPAAVQYLTPAAVSFFALGAVSAAVMSSIDSSILATSTVFARNIYKNVFRTKASEMEQIWVMRITVLVSAALATVLSLTVNSIYVLFVLSGDFVYVILFPQLLCVIYVPVSNTYGSLTGYIVGYALRLAAGEPAINIPALIRYPLFDVVDGVPTQLFPFRTLTMFVTLSTITLVSVIAQVIFKRGYLDGKWDVFKCFTDTEQPIEDMGAETKEKGMKYAKEKELDTKTGGNLNHGFKAKGSDLDTDL